MFRKLWERLPDVQYTVVGFGKFGGFPNWIEDKRVSEFGNKTEHDLCRVYSESRVVLGVHGSSMILPSAHAGMTISLMPEKRWGNFAQDIFISETDTREALYCKRVLPSEITINELVDICFHMVNDRKGYIKRMVMPFEDL